MVRSNRQLKVPPGFRFHPTDEELLYYYLRKKQAYEAIDLDVIRDVDLNKLEPWDLKDKCNIGSGPQDEWYFFSRKDKKYPTGTRTNRATAAGFWKATGRDKVIHISNSKRIGMRKTLVFYTGRAPHGQKTDWIMHEYRLDHGTSQEEGWVVCRVFQKKSCQRSILHEVVEEDQYKSRASDSYPLEQEQGFHALSNFSCNNSTHLPQLHSSDPVISHSVPPISVNSLNMQSPQNLMKLTSGRGGIVSPGRLNWDWSILDKLLASHQNQDQILKRKINPSTIFIDSDPSIMGKPGQYICCETDILNFSKINGALLLE